MKKIKPIYGLVQWYRLWLHPNENIWILCNNPLISQCCCLEARGSRVQIPAWGLPVCSLQALSRVFNHFHPPTSLHQGVVGPWTKHGVGDKTDWCFNIQQCFSLLISAYLNLASRVASTVLQTFRKWRRKRWVSGVNNNWVTSLIIWIIHRWCLDGLLLFCWFIEEKLVNFSFCFFNRMEI